jgi:hypothetical protein
MGARVVRFGLQAVGVGGCVLALGACAGRAVSKSEVEREEKPRELARTDLPLADENTEDLRRYIDQTDPITEMNEWEGYTGGSGEPREFMEAPARAGIDTPTDTGRGGDAPIVAIEAPDPLADEPTTTDTPLSAPAAEPAVIRDDADAETPDARLARQVAELRATIRELRADGDCVGAEAVELMALGLLDTDESGETDALKQKLPPAQRRALETLRELLVEVRSDESGLTALDARRVSRLLAEHAEKLADTRPLKIATAALCTSVESYGRYSAFPSNTFLQGRAQPVIVYVGLANFGQRPLSAAAKPDALLVTAGFNPPSEKEREKQRADQKNGTPKKKSGWAAPTGGAGSGGGDYVVELTQSIAIHNDADDLIVWRAPDASIRDVSRDRRQDYDLVQRLDLPSRLTLGKYNVKVTVRDVATGSTDETVIPIEIVADPALVRAR